MAAKIPVLVSNVDGPMEVIDNGKYGYFFESKNAESLATLIEEVMSDYTNNIVKSVVEKAYVRVAEEFDIKNTAINYLNAYK